MSTAPRAAAAAAVLTALGCGQEIPRSVSLQFPGDALTSAYLCQEIQGLAAMKAELYVAGHEEMPCALELGLNLSAAGDCERITVGAIRPLMVRFFLDVGAGKDGSVAFMVGSVDLRDEALVELDTSLPVPVHVGTDAVLVSPQDVTAISIPFNDCMRKNSGDEMQWARCTLEQELGFGLDCDNDGDANILEACTAMSPGLVCP